MRALKELLGAAFLGAAFRNYQAILDSTDVEDRRGRDTYQVIERYRKRSLIGGAVRGGLMCLFIRGANWGLGQRIHELARRYSTLFADYIRQFHRT